MIADVNIGRYETEGMLTVMKIKLHCFTGMLFGRCKWNGKLFTLRIGGLPGGGV